MSLLLVSSAGVAQETCSAPLDIRTLSLQQSCDLGKVARDIALAHAFEKDLDKIVLWVTTVLQKVNDKIDAAKRERIEGRKTGTTEILTIECGPPPDCLRSTDDRNFIRSEAFDSYVQRTHTVRINCCLYNYGRLTVHVSD